MRESPHRFFFSRAVTLCIDAIMHRYYAVTLCIDAKMVHVIDMCELWALGDNNVSIHYT